MKSLVLTEMGNYMRKDMSVASRTPPPQCSYAGCSSPPTLSSSMCRYHTCKWYGCHAPVMHGSEVCLLHKCQYAGCLHPQKWTLTAMGDMLRTSDWCTEHHSSNVETKSK